MITSHTPFRHRQFSTMMNSRISLDEELEEPLREKETELANKPLEFLLDCLGSRSTDSLLCRIGVQSRLLSRRWHQHHRRLLFKRRGRCAVVWESGHWFHVDGIINKAEYAALAEVYTTACDAVFILNAGVIRR